MHLPPVLLCRSSPLRQECRVQAFEPQRERLPRSPALRFLLVKRRRLDRRTSAVREVSYPNLVLVGPLADPHLVPRLQWLGSLDPLAVDLNFAAGDGLGGERAS